MTQAEYNHLMEVTTRNTQLVSSLDCQGALLAESQARCSEQSIEIDDLKLQLRSERASAVVCGLPHR